MADVPQQAWWQRASLSTRIVAGLVIGIAVGLFFGEEARVLQPLADVYLRLMQMTVLPYLVLTLLTGLGQLNEGAARRMAWRGLFIFLLYWLLAIVVVAAMAAAFPAMSSATFFNPALAEERPGITFVDLYVPANPFNSLANSIIPAVVLFTGALGVAMIGVPHREILLANLRVFEAAVVRVTHFIIALTPIGAFAICAVAAGTLEPATLGRLEAYLFTFGIASVLLTFVLIPLTVTAVTPFTYRQVVGTVKDALLTAFVSNNVLIVLPILTEHAKTLLAEQGHANADTDSAAAVLVPIGYTFPNAGRLLTLLFVPFAAWLGGVQLGNVDYVTLFTAGIASYFAKAQVALPFLMELVGVPHGLAEFYIPTTIITGKFDSMVSAINLFAMVLLGSASLAGFLVFERRRVLRAVALMLLATLLAGAFARGVLSVTIDTRYRKDELLTTMRMPHPTLPTVVHPLMPERECPVNDTRSAVERIRARGILWVGFVPDAPPYSFFNATHEFVGFDRDLADRLARELGVGNVEFMPVEWRDVGSALRHCRIDVMMSVPVTLIRLDSVRYSTTYLDTMLALSVPTGKRHDYASVDRMRKLKSITIGVPPSGRPGHRSFEDLFAGLKVRYVDVESPRAYFEGQLPDVDVLLLRGEVAAAWSLQYPGHTFITPQPQDLRVPLAVGLRPDDWQLADFVENWLAVQAADGTIDKAREYWMLGRGAQDNGPRWSIKRNVLRW